MKLEQAFGETIRRLRKERGLSQEDVSFQTGIDRSFLSELENGKKVPSLRTVMILADGLGMPASDIVKLAEDRLVELS